MTTALSPAHSSPERAAILAMFTPEQRDALIRALFPETQRLDSLGQTAIRWAERLAANGLIPDLAQHCATELLAFESSHPAIVGWLEQHVPALLGGSGITASDAARMGVDLLAAVDKLTTPTVTDSDVIDTTARLVPDAAPAGPATQLNAAPTF